MEKLFKLKSHGTNARTEIVVLGMGYSWQTALTAVFVEGIIFIILSLTNVREAIFNAIPTNLKVAVSVGIGLFICFIGLQNAHVAVDSATLVSMFSFSESIKSGSFSSEGITVLLALIGLLITAFLVIRQIKGNLLIGIVVTWLLGILCETDTAHYSFTVKEGDIIVMVSDGVPTDGSTWLEDTLGQFGGDSPDELARTLLSMAEKRRPEGEDDDITVMIGTIA